MGKQRYSSITNHFISAPKDMNQTFATVIHAAPKLDVQELGEVSKQLQTVLGKEIVQEFHVNKDLLNPLVSTHNK